MTRLALVLGGGGSLGAYTAGAATEILFALGRNRAGTPVTVDVIAGTSAGGLTAALLARALTVNPNLLPWIERVWIDALDAEALLDPDRADRRGWLDVSVLETLAGALITADPASDDHPAPLLGDSLHLGFSLSPLAPPPSAASVDFELRRGNGAGDPIWERIREAAIATASFPFAFPPRRLPWLVDVPCTDGTLFGEGALALARRLAQPAASGVGDAPGDRRYVVIEPSPRTSGGTNGRAAANSRAAADGTEFVELAGTIARFISAQRSARDRARAGSAEARRELLAGLVARLPEVSDRIADPAAVALGRSIGEIAMRVAEREATAEPSDGAAPAPGGDPVLDILDSQLRRIGTDPGYSSALATADGRAGRTRLAKFIYVLESMAGLRGAESGSINVVDARSGALACDFMGGFGGFFHRACRADDFRAGRRDARSLLEGALADVVDYDPDGPEAYRAGEARPGVDALPDDSRRRLEHYIDAEARRSLEDVDAGPIGNLLGGIWRPALRRWSVRRTTAALRGMDA